MERAQGAGRPRRLGDATNCPKAERVTLWVTLDDIKHASKGR